MPCTLVTHCSSLPSRESPPFPQLDNMLDVIFKGSSMHYSSSMLSYSPRKFATHCRPSRRRAASHISPSTLSRQSFQLSSLLQSLPTSRSHGQYITSLAGRCTNSWELTGGSRRCLPSIRFSSASSSSMYSSGLVSACSSPSWCSTATPGNFMSPVRHFRYQLFFWWRAILRLVTRTSG